MELTALFELIQKTLVKQGFKLANVLRNSMTCAHFIAADSDLQLKPVGNKFIYDAFYGNWLEVREVSRRNGAKYNTSYYMIIVDCVRSSAKDAKKIKLKCDQTEPTLVRKIDKFAREYKTYVEMKTVEEVIDNCLDKLEVKTNDTNRSKE